ncbi:MAG: isoprenylcysteine carboxylmethyltransferase family protein [Chloroflexi bacterium]|nr:isoprenylcysteine carboxylmethyltransferase family protein [Chloroflexota bacterium]
MLSFIVLLLAIAVYGLAHSWLASLGVKARARAWFGPAADRWYRLAYNAFAALSFLPLLALYLALPDRPLYALPAPWSYLCLAGQSLAVLALGVGVMQTGLGAFLGLEQALGGVQSPGALTTGGFYRWVRHPLYTAGLAFLWFSPTMSWNGLAFSLGLSAYLVFGALFEERKLLREHGPAYADYQRRTPMLIPFWFMR